tara:strand:+ start:7744 stop:7929 length:186 start_codon:yes stop_codon:yes gene_type:complete
MRYELIKDWPSKRHGKTIGKGAFVIITIEDELKELIELECIVKPKKKKVKKEEKKQEKKEN